MESSGSTGLPKRFYFTDTDLSVTREFFSSGMQNLIGEDGRVLVLLSWQQFASVGELLIHALLQENVYAEGMWPLQPEKQIVKLVKDRGLNCIVGLPHHLLAVSEMMTGERIKSMLLCSDYAPDSLRKRIEQNCGCKTFLHYGSTESGLGGGVECSCHNGCHIRESDLLVEIIDPFTGRQLPDGEPGEVVITTLGREAMVLIRYRTGDRACLELSMCECGGVTARLVNVFGRLQGCPFPGGEVLYSQNLDERLYGVPGLLDFRVTLSSESTGVARLSVEYAAMPGIGSLEEKIKRELIKIKTVRDGVETKRLALGSISEVADFAPSHTVKRAVLDIRSRGEKNAHYSG